MIGFSSIVLSKKYLPFYLAEAAYKYNRRGEVGSLETFTETLENAVHEEKCSVKYKPKAYPSFLANRLKKKKLVNERKMTIFPFSQTGVV